MADKYTIGDAPAKYSIGDAPAQSAAAPPAQLGDLTAAPDRSPSEYMEDAGRDLRQGGNRTVVGKGLGYLTGQGDKGYQGLEAGVSPETAEFMGSVPLGLARAGKGQGQIFEGHPIKGLGNMVAGAAQASEIPLSFAGPEAVEVGASALPSRAHAGEVLQSIREAAKDVPVNPQNVWEPLERFQDLTKAGGSTSKPTTQLSTRLQNLVRMPDKGTLNFPEARDFYSNISSQSAEDVSRLNSIMRRQMGDVRQGLHQDLVTAADAVGRGAEYAQAIKEYALASRLHDLFSKGSKIALGMAGTGALGDLVYQRYLKH